MMETLETSRLFDDAFGGLLRAARAGGEAETLAEGLFYNYKRACAIFCIS